VPLVRISLRSGKSQEYQTAIADAVHQAMVETINVPPLDRFQLITEHDPGSLIYDPTYLDIKRSDDIVIIQVTLNTGRTVEMKRAFYARLAELLHQNPGLRKEDVMITLVEVGKENWSFGNGEAQYAMQ
jgi:4-oxalocrotonate tautomerase